MRQTSTQTSYVAVVGPNAAWAGEKPRKLADFGEDASNTIMLIEVTNSGIAWAEPRDLSLDTLGAADGKSPALALTSNHGRREEFFFTYDHGSGVHVAMADGSVRFLRTGNRSTEELRKLLQIGGFKEERSSGRLRERHLNWPNIAALAVWLLSVGTLLTGGAEQEAAAAREAGHGCQSTGRAVNCLTADCGLSAIGYCQLDGQAAQFRWAEGTEGASRSEGNSPDVW